MAEETKREKLRGRMLESMPKGARVAEIGVWEGAFSKRIMEICDPAELHLIDPWLYQPEFGNTGFGRKKNENLMEQKYQDVCDMFKDDARVKIHREMSDAALASLPDASLDWVYIDGNHNEPFIGQDIALCLKKVKHDGIIAGDDFNWMSDAQGAPVKRAVEAMVEELGDQAELKLMANQWIVKLNRPAA
ncbi:MAG: hypothetical protein BGP11_10920 [Rhodobacterales bacterium 65-51]|uniref:class I SAM-dependent methyltransferase n=1 Tax=uncultured Gemmobacter sp. TaxID=1095917 RepID=UPI0009625451|nr:class I SAM-dependent methyltransferase [uncultured Gemmobacter sp.]OJY27926.1 MAG: hypothetical protein BGP11_10920 [Rhodobacterales bacterium 65-51]